MARMQIVADARWISRTVRALLSWLALLLLVVYLVVGLWWTIGASLVLIALATSVVRRFRR